MISNVAKVVVPVDDQQAAVEFWTTTMGFSVVRDDTYADERWIEVKPPNQDLPLVLSLRPDEPRRTVPDGLPHSDLLFNCADIEQTHAELSRRGVKFPNRRPNSSSAGGRCSKTDDRNQADQPLTPDPTTLRSLDFLVGTWRVDGETSRAQAACVQMTAHGQNRPAVGGR
jgi:lactoylglutathione lyase